MNILIKNKGKQLKQVPQPGTPAKASLQAALLAKSFTPPPPLSSPPPFLRLQVQAGGSWTSLRLRPEAPLGLVLTSTRRTRAPRLDLWHRLGQVRATGSASWTSLRLRPEAPPGLALAFELRLGGLERPDYAKYDQLGRPRTSLCLCPGAPPELAKIQWAAFAPRHHRPRAPFIFCIRNKD